jgi:hypothetical protein
LQNRVRLQKLGVETFLVIADYQAALGACPWVEDDLRASADRAQALAGATLGTLGNRLSPELRANIVNRLTMRAFAEKEVIVTEGVPVPGILLVGAGKVELVLNGATVNFVAFAHFNPAFEIEGQIFALFIIVLAAAEAAVAATSRKNAGYLVTLAAAYAETGQFVEAAKAAQQALDLAQAAHDTELIPQLQTRLKLYQSAAPYHEP